MLSAREEELSRDYAINVLTWLARLSKHFGLAESPHQMLKRRWGDVLGMSIVQRRDGS